MRCLFVIAAVGVLMCHCGEPTETNNSETPDVDLSGFSADLAKVECERIFACCKQEEFDRIFVGQPIATVADCEEAVTSGVSAFVIPKFENAANLERIVVDQSAFGRCLTDLSVRSCDNFEPGRLEDFSTVGACSTAFAPALETSGFCDDDFECLSGFCSGSPETLEGSCANVPAIGQPCAFGRCGDDGFCDTINDVCQAKIANGEACPQSPACVSGFCTASDGSGTCEPPAPICEGT